MGKRCRSASLPGEGRREGWGGLPPPTWAFSSLLQPRAKDCWSSPGKEKRRRQGLGTHDSTLRKPRMSSPGAPGAASLGWVQGQRSSDQAQAPPRCSEGRLAFVASGVVGAWNLFYGCGDSTDGVQVEPILRTHHYLLNSSAFIFVGPQSRIGLGPLGPVGESRAPHEVNEAGPDPRLPLHVLWSSQAPCFLFFSTTWWSPFFAVSTEAELRGEGASLPPSLRLRLSWRLVCSVCLDVLLLGGWQTDHWPLAQASRRSRHRLPGAADGKKPPQCRRCQFASPDWGKFPWRRAWVTTPVSLAWEPQGHRMTTVHGVAVGVKKHSITEQLTLLPLSSNRPKQSLLILCSGKHSSRNWSKYRNYCI